MGWDDLVGVGPVGSSARVECGDSSPCLIEPQEIVHGTHICVSFIQRWPPTEPTVPLKNK